jgi:hypothetical protein
MSQAHCQNETVSSWRGETNSAVLATALEPKAAAREMNSEFAGMVEAEFEEELQEFCRFARLGFTILNQPASQLADVGNVLRSLGDGSAADDLLKLVISGREKALLLMELTNAAKLRWEAAFLNGPGLIDGRV